MIAALFVAEHGPYTNLPGVDAWTKDRDARKYAGPWPVVAHPPCERWGKYWSGGPSAKVRRKKGDDGGCFESALRSVRAFGGVLEHPAWSAAWPHFGLLSPPMDGGWVSAGDWIGWTCHVEQGHYGHPARKATWLYAVTRDLPSLIWGPSSGIRMDEGFHSKDERARCRDRADQADLRASPCRDPDSVPRSARTARRAFEVGMTAFERLPKSVRHLTPVAFREVLLSIARSA